MQIFVNALKIDSQLSSSKIADLIINKKADSPQKIVAILSAKKLSMDKNELISITKTVLENNLSVVEEFKKGKETVVEFLVGQVMSQTKGQADPNQIREILREKLKAA